MITVAEAKQIITNNIIPLSPAKAAIMNASGRLLATDVYAVADIPAFPQSSMDGYAFSFDTKKAGERLVIEGEIAAGSTSDNFLTPGKAVRIFTGAPVPPGADTVVMQEKVEAANGMLSIHDDLLKKGANVRPKGSEITAGQLALPAGTFLTPAAVGFLAGIGVAEVNVYPHPSITLIITGKELQKPGSSPRFGQVYESNSYALTAALKQLHIETVNAVWVDDDLALLTEVLNKALAESDMVLLTGGISAGDYDFVLQAATECGVSQLFHKVKQRPGKPLYFGMKGNKVVFGLPGNPSSVLTCFYEYVVPALSQMSHLRKELVPVKAPLLKPIQKAAGLTHFLKGHFDGKAVAPLTAQESYRMSTYATANCLIVVEEETTACKEGEIIEIHLLP